MSGRKKTTSFILRTFSQGFLFGRTPIISGNPDLFKKTFYSKATLFGAGFKSNHHIKKTKFNYQYYYHHKKDNGYMPMSQSSWLTRTISLSALQPSDMYIINIIQLH